ncbi:proton-conducting transporter transmembrane domain-containing protein [Woodsholea maritima]|uniref:proton-conducting transporter transmembrane domain-containing protein n=1 Tax=Woodsholea maritima TaxID=240237 RepID=UPI00037C470E|nr:proton-conducting transporter membrane subunit [Woodsholea maritima]
MTWTPELALGLALALPLAGGVGVVAFGRYPNVREAMTLIAAVLLAINVAYLVEIAPSNPTIELFEFAPGLSLKFKLEPLGALFAMVASGLWILNSLYSIGYMRGNKEKDQTRFYLCFTLSIAAAMGVALSGNLITLFFFYEALTFSTYPLVAHKGDAKARKGATIYMSILLSTSIGLLLPAVLITYFVAGTTDFTPGGILGAAGPVLSSVILCLFAFGIGKAALMPVHPWLPNAMVAPTPVSALLHAVAVVKAGVFSMLKVTTYVFGPLTMAATPAADALAWLAGFSIVAASIIAMTQDNLKARLAYSTVSQLSYVTLGAMLASPAAMLGAALQIVMHAFAKITLFMGAGAIYTGTKKTNISDMAGLGKFMPVTFAAFGIASLSLIGLPPFGGTWPKFFLMQGSDQAGHPWLMAALIGSSLLNIGYLLPIVINAFFKKPKDDAPMRPGMPPLLAVLPPLLTAIATFVLFLLIDPLVSYLAPVFSMEIAS